MAAGCEEYLVLTLLVVMGHTNPRVPGKLFCILLCLPPSVTGQGPTFSFLPVCNNNDKNQAYIAS